jgi:hypothetical protein
MMVSASFPGGVCLECFDFVQYGATLKGKQPLRQEKQGFWTRRAGQAHDRDEAAARAGRKDRD